jgi:hypothetical protein
VANSVVTVVDLRAVGGRHVGGVDDVLHADRETVQRPAPLLGVPRARLRERLLCVEVRPRPDVVVARRDHRQAFPHELLRAHLAGGEQPAGFDGGELRQLGHPRQVTRDVDSLN